MLDKRIPFLRLFFLLLLLAAALPLGRRTAVPLAPSPTMLLSDHDQTTAFGADRTTFVRGAAHGGTDMHSWWFEYAGGGEADDLFYRRLPDGDTQLLTDRDESAGNVNLHFLVTAVDSAGEFHIAWFEDTGGAEGFDLFYWSAATGTLLVTDRTASEGVTVPAVDGENLWLALDANDQPHLLWQERNGSDDGFALFYWNGTDGTQLLDTQPGPIGLTTSGTTAHIFWIDSVSGGASYWNSTAKSETAVSLVDSGGLFNNVVILPESDGSATLYWLEFSSSNCLVNWNSQTQSSAAIIVRPGCLSGYKVVEDENGRRHALGLNFDNGQFTRIYWNDTLADALVVQSDTPGVPGMLHLGGDTAHVTWFSSETGNDDLFHWDASKQTVTNLSADQGSNTAITRPTFRARVSHTGVLHVHWLEQGSNGPLYWNSAAGIVVDLAVELGMDSIDPSNTLMMLDGGDSAHFLFRGTPNGGSEGLYYWKGGAATAVQLDSGAFEHGNFQLYADPRGMTHAAWHNGATFNYWNDTDGKEVLTATTAVETADAVSAPLFAESIGVIYLFWYENSDAAGEGLDIFAASANYREVTFLPQLITE